MWVPTWFLVAGGQRQLERGEKRPRPSETWPEKWRGALPLVRSPAGARGSGFRSRVSLERAQVPAGTAARPGARRAQNPPWLSLLFPGRRNRARRSLEGPEGRRDLRPDPGAPHVRKVRHFYRLPADRQFAVPRTTLSLGASGLVWPEDFFFFKTKERKINVLFLTQCSFLAPQPPLVLSPFFFEVTETKEGHRHASILQ